MYSRGFIERSQSIFKYLDIDPQHTPNYHDAFGDIKIEFAQNINTTNSEFENEGGNGSLFPMPDEMIINSLANAASQIRDFFVNVTQSEQSPAEVLNILQKLQITQAFANTLQGHESTKDSLSAEFFTFLDKVPLHEMGESVDMSTLVDEFEQYLNDISETAGANQFSSLYKPNTTESVISLTTMDDLIHAQQNPNDQILYLAQSLSQARGIPEIFNTIGDGALVDLDFSLDSETAIAMHGDAALVHASEFAQAQPAFGDD